MKNQTIETTTGRAIKVTTRRNPANDIRCDRNGCDYLIVSKAPSGRRGTHNEIRRHGLYRVHWQCAEEFVVGLEEREESHKAFLAKWAEDLTAQKAYERKVNA